MRTIPEALQSDLDSDCTTLCDLLQVVSKAGVVLGMTSLDRRLDYDAGDLLGTITYQPDPGFERADVELASDLSVDNTEGRALIPLAALPMNADDIRAGLWDDAAFKVMRLNYLAPDHGHYEVLSGTFGDITLRNNAVLVIQLDGNTRPLRQTMCWRDSLKCRAVFGSQEADEIEFCGADGEADLVTFTVTSVSEGEPNRVFTSTDIADLEYADGWLVPGIVLWDTGDNAGNTVRGIDSSLADGTLGLRDEMPRAIQVGDTGRTRPDCTKDVEGDKGCKYYFSDDWGLHFRGEPDIPMGGDAQVPGAQAPPGAGGSTNIPEEEA